MSGSGGFIGRGTKIAELALWTLAAMVVLSTHVGGAIWLMREPPVMPADNVPPAAIMIELAEVSEAVSTDENEISPDEETAEASEAAEPMDAPEEPPAEELEEIVEDEVVEPEPVEELMEETPDEVESEPVKDETEPVEETAPVLTDDVAVPIPTPRPAPPPKPKREVVEKEPKKKPVRQRQQQQSASQQSTRAQAQVQQAERNAARQSASGRSSKVSPARWQSRLLAHLERRKRYPSSAKRRREQGVAYVRFSIDTNGTVLSVRLARSSGFADLDAEVVAMVKRASPVPAPPPGVNRTITVPVRFDLR